MSTSHFEEPNPERKTQIDWFEESGIRLFRPDFGNASYELNTASVSEVLAKTFGQIALTPEIEAEMQGSDLFECINRNCDTQEYFVQPLNTVQKEEGLFRVHLRCANCELDVIRDATQEQVVLFDEFMDEGYEELVFVRRQLLREIAEDETKLLIDAINAGHIQPIDF